MTSMQKRTARKYISSKKKSLRDICNSYTTNPIWYLNYFLLLFYGFDWTWNEHCRKFMNKMLDWLPYSRKNNTKKVIEFSWGYLLERWHNPFIYLALILCSHEWNRSIYGRCYGGNIEQNGNTKIWATFIHYACGYVLILKFFRIDICNDDGCERDV